MKVEGRWESLRVAVLICTLFTSLWAAGHTASGTEASVETSTFGTLEDGTAVEAYTLKNSKGASAKITTYGATLTELWMPDRTGKLADVVLGHDNVQGYVGKTPWFGATVGRVANRIAKGKFTLDGKEYSLEINNPPNNLHSGSKDLSHVAWKAEPVHEKDGAAVRFSYNSPDGDEGFPGNLLVTVLYRLTNNNELELFQPGRRKGCAGSRARTQGGEVHAGGCDPDSDGGNQASQRHAAGLHTSGRNWHPHRRDGGRPRRLRPQLRAERAGRQTQKGGAGFRAYLGQADGGLDD